MFTMLSNIYNYLKWQKLAEMKGERWDSPFMVHFQIQSEVTFLENPKISSEIRQKGGILKKRKGKRKSLRGQSQKKVQKGGTPSERVQFGNFAYCRLKLQPSRRVELLVLYNK